MKFIFLVLFATIAVVCGQLHDGRFTVPVDHFRPQDGRTVSFVSARIDLSDAESNVLILKHYRTNIEYFENDGPLFFYLSDAGQFTTEWIERGLIADLAMEFGGALFTANLRYFRDNLPTA